MLRHMLTVAGASLVRSPVFTAINLIGMALGIASCLMILIFIRYETSFDEWLPRAERTYQVNQLFEEGPTQMVPQIAAPALRDNFAEVEAVTRLTFGRGVARRGALAMDVPGHFEADANFLDVLDLPLLHGSRDGALAGARAAIISETTARRLFGRADAVGRTLTLVTAEGDEDYAVTAVFRDIPSNSHLVMQMLTRRSPTTEANTSLMGSWNNISGYVYARLRPGADAAAIQRELPEAIRRSVPAAERDPVGDNDFAVRLINVADVNTQGAEFGAARNVTPQSTINAFGIVALFMLIMACVNFTNLSTARGSRRAREIGLRKTLGSTRWQLVALFLIESVLMAAVAGLLGMALAELFTPWLGRLVDAPLTGTIWQDRQMFAASLLLILVVGVAGGAYPAFYLSRYRPAEVLKAGRGGETFGSGRLRLILVLVQFAVSIGLIACTAIVYGQTLYASHTDPGYRPEGVLLLEGGSRLERPAIETLVRQLSGIDGVRSVSRTNIVPNPPTMGKRRILPAGGGESVSIQVARVDGAFFDTFGLRLLGGRLISDRREADIGPPPFDEPPALAARLRETGINVVVDDLAVRQLGFRTIRDAIGASMLTPAQEDGTRDRYNIVGVVNSARFSTVRLERTPMLYWISPVGGTHVALRFSGADGLEVDRAARRIWQRLQPDLPYASSFADTRLEEMYATETARANLLATFSALAVLVSSLGLFGLAAFTAERRTKEIGIRKVVGARTQDIVRLLAWDFLKPVVLANLIAWPIAWWVMRDWLNGFSERISLHPGWFIGPGLLALAIALGTIAGHAIRVARANPIQALRYE